MIQSQQDILSILKQVEAHELSAENASLQLDSLLNEEPIQSDVTGPTAARWLRVHITDSQNNVAKAQVNIPIGLVDVSHHMGARFVPTLDEASYAELIEQAQLCQPGTTFEFFDEVNQEKIELVVD